VGAGGVGIVDAQPAARACGACLARGWLLARLAGHLDPVRARITELLSLDSEKLVAAVGGERAAGIADELRHFDRDAALGRVRELGLEAICRCDSAYPARLASVPHGPAALYVRGGLDRFLSLVEEQPVAIVGARRASGYGLGVARSLARGIASSGVTVISGMALGIDSAAHEGALAAGGTTVAVLPGPAERPYPAAKRPLHRRIASAGAVVSELPPGAELRRWAFPARNRIIAALSALTVVVEAGRRSGALVTARAARDLGRPVGAVPGRVTAPQATGTNTLIARGAVVIRNPQDVLDALYGPGVRRACVDARPGLGRGDAALLAAVANGDDTIEALVREGFEAEGLLTALASLELDGYLRRGAGGRFAVVP
jgi:DNA processing protein